MGQPNLYRCGVCSAEFDSQRELDAHIWREHKQTPPSPPPGRRESPATPTR